MQIPDYITMKVKFCFGNFGILLLGLLFAGCQSYFENPYFTVEESGLNWVSIRYYNYTREPIRKVNVRVDGNGIISVKEGTSPLVSNAFAADIRKPTWSDIRESRFSVPREEVVPLFQMLVDNGLFAERRKGLESSVTNESIFVTANIQNKTCGSSDDDVFASDPDLAERLKTVILMYYHPSPARRR